MRILSKLPIVEECAFCGKQMMSQGAFQLPGDRDHYCSLSCLMTDYGFETRDGEIVPDNRALKGLKIRGGLK